MCPNLKSSTLLSENDLVENPKSKIQNRNYGR